MNWTEFEMSGAIETQQYMKDVSNEMRLRVASIKKDLNPIYFNLLMNKLASALPSNFLLNIYKIKKTISTETSQQFLFDVQNELKTILLTLPSIQLDESNKVVQDLTHKNNDSYTNFVNKNIQKVMARFKVMGYPLDKDAITEGYQQILDQTDKNDKNKSGEDLIAILTIRGLNKNNAKFQEQLSKLDNWINSKI